MICPLLAGTNGEDAPGSSGGMETGTCRRVINRLFIGVNRLFRGCKCKAGWSEADTPKASLKGLLFSV